MRETSPVGARHHSLEVALDLDRVLLTRQAEPLRETPDVRVDHDPLRVPELRRHDVRGLARDARKADEVLEPPRNLAVELLDERLHRAADRLRLLPEEARRVDVALELLDRDGEVVLGPAVLLEERRRDLVDVHVGRLRGEHHGDEQLEVAAEPKRDLRVGVLLRETVDDRDDALSPPAEPAAARLADVATRHAATRSTAVVVVRVGRVEEVARPAARRPARRARDRSDATPPRRTRSAGTRHQARAAPRTRHAPLVRHAHTSGIDDTKTARERSVVLHVRVPADEDVVVDQPK